jgi:hypothetical protein
LLPWLPGLAGNTFNALMDSFPSSPLLEGPRLSLKRFVLLTIAAAGGLDVVSAPGVPPKGDQQLFLPPFDRSAIGSDAPGRLVAKPPTESGRHAVSHKKAGPPLNRIE